jgi:hypothetical protein
MNRRLRAGGVSDVSDTIDQSDAEVQADVSPQGCVFSVGLTRTLVTAQGIT